jgi:hypothetical protein
MQDRFDMYSGVHKGLRNAMQFTMLRLGQLDPSDGTDVGDALATLRDVLVWLEAHLSIEERFVHAAIDRKRPGGSVSHVRNDHDGHLRDIALLRTDADALERCVNEPVTVRRARARQLYLSWSRFVGENLAHMAFEETEMNALIWELFSDAEIAEIFGAIVASESQDQLGRTVRWMMPALDPETRAHLIGNARASIPEPVFAHLLSGMQQALSPRDYAKLAAALDASQAA